MEDMQDSDSKKTYIFFFFSEKNIPLQQEFLPSWQGVVPEMAGSCAKLCTIEVYLRDVCCTFNNRTTNEQQTDNKRTKMGDNWEEEGC